MSKTYTFNLNDFPEWAEFNWIQFEIDNSIEALKKLYQINKDAFNTICHDLEDKVGRLRNNNAKLDAQELHDYTQHLYGLEEKTILELNNVQNSSIIIYVFAIFENKLKLISDKIQIDFKYEIAKQKSDSYTSEYWKTLKSFSNKIGVIEKYLTPIKNQMILRNIIIHQNSIATANQYKTIGKLKGLTFNEFEGQHYLINIECSFIDQLIPRLEIFFKELLSILKSETNDRIRNVA